MFYPIEAIVLRKSRIDEHRWVMSCFSKEYGKIDIFLREQRGTHALDTLSYFSGRIFTKEKNSLSQIYALTSFSSVNTYEIYDIAGWSASILYSLLPHGLPYQKLFQLLKAILQKESFTINDFFLFLVQTCRDFGITQCDIQEYALRIQDRGEHQKIRSDIESWISDYSLS